MTISTLNRLLELGETKGMKCGLENMIALDQALGFPSRSFQSVHIAGTNGKGSVTTKIARSLIVEKVGLYTSPHLFHFKERIDVNGRLIDDEEAEEWGDEIFYHAKRLKINPTYFEILTLLAFLHFQKKEVSVAVLEVGMGGRWDATNIVTPLASIITSIDLDHTRYLGNTLEAIAGEKAGIIKQDVPVIVGPQAAKFSIFLELAKQKKAPFFEVLGPFANFEEENRAIARKALEQLPFPFDEKGIEITPACRFQIFEKEIPILLDVGHNPGALKSLINRTKAAFPCKNLSFLCAFSSDKEIDACLEVLKQSASFITLTEAPNRRAASIDELSLNGFPHHKEKKLKEALDFARKRAFQSDEILVICGTFFIMAEIISALKEEKGPSVD